MIVVNKRLGIFFKIIRRIFYCCQTGEFLINCVRSWYEIGSIIRHSIKMPKIICAKKLSTVRRNLTKQFDKENVNVLKPTMGYNEDFPTDLDDSMMRNSALIVEEFGFAMERSKLAMEYKFCFSEKFYVCNHKTAGRWKRVAMFDVKSMLMDFVSNCLQLSERERSEIVNTDEFREDCLSVFKEIVYDRNFDNKLDTNKLLFACQNGVLDLHDTKAVLRPTHPLDYVSLHTTWSYNAEMSKKYITEVTEFMESLFPDRETLDFVQCFIANAIVSVETRTLVLRDCVDGGAGKSAFLNFIEYLFGLYATSYRLRHSRNARLCIEDDANKDLIVEHLSTHDTPGIFATKITKIGDLCGIPKDSLLVCVLQNKIDNQSKIVLSDKFHEWCSAGLDYFRRKMNKTCSPSAEMQVWKQEFVSFINH